MNVSSQKRLGLVIVLALLLTSCGSSKDEDQSHLLVFAAASLTDAFTELASAFEADNPGLTVGINLSGSSTLREQILEGAPADVFASANESNMEKVGAGGAVEGTAQIFVRNSLQIVVPPGNPGGVTGLADFSQSNLLIGLCAEQVPCGGFGREALAKAGVEPSVDTNEPDVRALLTKVEVGELDAGIVYVTDVVSAGDKVEAVTIPAEFNVAATYPIATLKDASNPVQAEAFVTFVLSETGQTILQSHGFSSP